MPAGRPTDYKPAFAAQAAKLCEFGATDQDLADCFGVVVSTIYRWKAAHPEFCDAVKAGKVGSDDRVERSLYHKAVGYSYDAVKIMQANGEPLTVPYREHVPPDTTAAIFWLKNRKPAEWRDKRDVEVTGADGGPIEITNDRERAKALLALIAKAQVEQNAPGGAENAD